MRIKQPDLTISHTVNGYTEEIKRLHSYQAMKILYALLSHSELVGWFMYIIHRFIHRKNE